MENNILYLQKGNRTVIISCVGNKVIVVDSSLDDYLDNLCLQELTTLKGRVEAIKRKCHIRKNVPIYITSQVVLFPTSNKKSVDNIYVNSVFVKNIDSNHNLTNITFYDDTILTIDKPSHIIKLYYEKCLKIKKLINEYC